jgi:hypothetical protein
MAKATYSNVSFHPWIFKDSNCCKWKFDAIYKQYKDDKIVNKISSNDCHQCLFCDALDSWWHRSGNVMKHVSIFVDET